MDKKRLLGGLGVTVVSLSIIASFGTKLAYDREGDVNLALKITAPTIQGDGNAQYFKSDYESKEAMYDALKQYNVKAQVEGTVLLKNKDNALPLKATDKVTLLGKASTNPVYHGGSGGPINYQSKSLVDVIKEGGYSLNEEVSNAVKNVKADHDKFGNIGEVDVTTYNGVSTSFASYDDAAIIVLKRFGGEEGDLNHGLQGLWEKGPHIRELSLHDEEKDVLNLVKNSSFKKRIVIVNSGYPMELEELDEYDIDAVLWIGYPGSFGMYGVSDILFGKADPSGRLVDTYAANSLSSAAMQNAGDFKFANLTDLYKREYLVYAEGIYVGYKYYETRYNDLILNQHNADDAVGIYNSKGGKWNYADEVTYSFGDGMSYASFAQQIESFEWNKDTHEVTAKVKVTNNGNDNYSGKSEDVVQLYAQLPYEAGQAEKSAIQLLDFAKTKELAKGESEEITLKFSDYYFATYDQNATNGEDASKKGCYTFDAGDYYFALGNGAHDALNNILAKQGKTGMYDAANNPVAGDVNKVQVVNLAALDNKTYAKSPYTGEIVSNLFEDRDINSFYETDVVTYLTRSDWKTFPKPYKDLEATPEIKHLMEDSLYKKPADAPDIKSFKQKIENGIKFVDMKDVDFDDPKWEDFIDQLSAGELAQIIGDKMAMDAIKSISFPAYSGGDGPDGHQTSNVIYVNEIVGASTFSKESLENRGRFFGEESLYLGFKHIYGPGANIHRTPYSGRNFEYYSEDAMMSFLCGQAQEKGMVEKGIAGMIKHFCGNDQETNRHGVATFLTEQAYRQGPLKGFEGALTNNGSLGTMTAYNRIGCIPTAADYQTMTLVLRKEWGFKGINMTDSSKDASSYMSTADCLYAGTNQFNNDKDRVSEASSLLTKSKDGFIWQKLRDTAHYYLYAMSRSNLINGLASDTVVKDFVPWWKPATIVLDISLGVIGAGLLGVYVFLSLRKKKGE